MTTQLTLFPKSTPAPKAPAESPFASAFDDFTLEQRKQIIAWNNKHTYDETIDLIRKEFGISVARSSLARFHNRTALFNQLEDSPDAQAAADEILMHISSSNRAGNKLTAAAIAVLEQTAFKLALTCADKPAHLDALNRINLIICRARNTAVRERHATVQEMKCDLRARELALKELHFNRNLTGVTSPSDVAQTACLRASNSQATGGALSAPACDPLSSTDSINQSTQPSVEASSDTSSFRHPIPRSHTDSNKTAHPPAESTHSNHSENDAKLTTPNSPPSVSSVPSVPSVQPPPTAPAPSASAPIPTPPREDDPLAHFRGLVAGTIKPTWIPAEIPCEEEDHFLDLYFPEAARERKARAAEALAAQQRAPRNTDNLASASSTDCSPASSPAPSPVGPAPSPEGTSENSPDASAPGNTRPLPPSPEGTADPSTRTPPACATALEMENVANPLPETSNSNLTTPNSPLSVPSVPIPSVPSVQPPPIPTPTPTTNSTLPATVDAYTVRRMREYIAHNQRYTPWPYKQYPPAFLTKFRHCPCGHGTHSENPTTPTPRIPCPIHEDPATFGPYPEQFWKISALNPLYADCLQDRNLPFRFPTEFLP